VATGRCRWPRDRGPTERHSPSPPRGRPGPRAVRRPRRPGGRGDGAARRHGPRPGGRRTANRSTSAGVRLPPGVGDGAHRPAGTLSSRRQDGGGSGDAGGVGPRAHRSAPAPGAVPPPSSPGHLRPASRTGVRHGPHMTTNTCSCQGWTSTTAGPVVLAWSDGARRV
jgi:hypothetical protein